MKICVGIADDHAVVRDGIKSVIQRSRRGIRVIAEASDGRQLLRCADQAPDAIYLVDISMPGLNGIEACRRIVRKHPRCAVIILSMHDNAFLVEKAFGAGARGYIRKENASEEIVPAIYAVSRGKLFVSEAMHKIMPRLYAADHGQGAAVRRGMALTTRESEIIQRVAEGCTSRQIADALCVSLHTVLTHRRNIARKLGIHGQADLIRYALKHALAAV